MGSVRSFNSLHVHAIPQGEDNASWLQFDSGVVNVLELLSGMPLTDHDAATLAAILRFMTRMVSRCPYLPRMLHRISFPLVRRSSTS